MDHALLQAASGQASNDVLRTPSSGVTASSVQQSQQSDWGWKQQLVEVQAALANAQSQKRPMSTGRAGLRGFDRPTDLPEQRDQWRPIAPLSPHVWSTRPPTPSSINNTSQSPTFRAGQPPVTPFQGPGHKTITVRSSGRYSRPSNMDQLSPKLHNNQLLLPSNTSVTVAPGPCQATSSAASPGQSVESDTRAYQLLCEEMKELQQELLLSQGREEQLRHDLRMVTAERDMLAEQVELDKGRLHRALENTLMAANSKLKARLDRISSRVAERSAAAQYATTPSGITAVRR